MMYLVTLVAISAPGQSQYSPHEPPELILV